MNSMSLRDLNDERAGDPAIAHQTLHALLPLYATTIALGGAQPAGMSDLEQHLAVCTVCRAELEELSILTSAAYSDQIAAAPAYPAPDLTFLRAAQVRAHDPPWLLDEVGRLVVQFSAMLLKTLRPPALAGAARGQFLYRYVQDPGSVDDLEVTIEVFAEDTRQERGRVRVAVDVPSRGPFDQSGSQVVVRADEQAWQGETDEAGCVDFAPIPLAALPRLKVEIAPLR
jgi:hypothetical protein